MKKVLVFLLLLTAIAWSQQKVTTLDNIRPEFYTLTLDSATSSILYYIWPPPSGLTSTNRDSLSITLPTSTKAQAKNLDFNSSGALTIAIVTDTLNSEESDSLYAYVQTLVYDKTKATFYRSINDTLFLDFDTPGTYTGTAIDYLDWTHGGAYTANVGSEIMPGAGLAITFGQVNQTGGDTKLYISLWMLR